MQLAIAYTWITEGTYDKEYVESHTYGFEEFEKYVMGQEDGVPKTPKWAAEICGVPSRTIKALARQFAKKATSIAHGNGGGYIRSCYSHEPARLEVMLLGMQGLGKPGRNQLKMIEWGLFSLNSQIPCPRPEVIPAMTRSTYKGQYCSLNRNFVVYCAIPVQEVERWHELLQSFPRETVLRTLSASAW
jgi:trimethylamine-N-oxide reductase (cytochrome c)